MTAVAESLISLRHARGDAAIVFDRARLPQADYGVFDPTAWGDAARPVGDRGGRGAAWFVRGEFGEGVLRHYRRGGLVARFNGDRYLWRGADRTRSFTEFRLLAELRDAGLPVPAPIAAGYRRAGLWYRADILVERIPDARSVAEILREDAGRLPWREIGRALARFHRWGACHADLNAHNILVDADARIWLIDFDRGRRLVPERGWRMRNLLRLQRSLLKLRGPHEVASILAGFRALAGAYEEALSKGAA